MRRNRRNNAKRERIIMVTSSVFVLTALTMTGFYIKDQNTQSKDDGYTIDFTALEDTPDEKYQEIARNDQVNVEEELNQITESLEPSVLEDDLDYMPMEAGSSLVEIPGLTGYSVNLPETDLVNEGASVEEEALDVIEEIAEEINTEEANVDEAIVAPTLNFSENDGLVRPVTGDILMHYSMDSSIYFATLDQYKYNPAVVFSAEQGSPVNACAQGKVIDIYDDAKIGKAVTLDLGNGYRATYGQLENIEVTLDSYVEAGDVLGFVGAPTKYYSVEGSNLYFMLTKDDAAVNPENMF